MAPVFVTRRIALAGVSLALVVGAPTAALAAGTSVSVRVEGVNRTLLPTKVVHTHPGSITKGGTPAGACSATAAAGALDAATHGSWDGAYSSGLGIEVTSILGETDKYSPNGHYWSIFVDNRSAQSGICGLKLHKGERILFAAISASGTTLVSGLSGPAHASVGHTFTLKAVAYPAHGNAKTLAGATVRGPGLHAVTDKHGKVTVSPQRTGKLTYTVSEKGYVRASDTVAVS